MRIECIFADRLFAFHHDDEADNELNRLMELWTDVKYLKDFATVNKVADIKIFVQERLSEVETIQDLLDEIDNKNKPLETFFQSLTNGEYEIKHLSPQKGKAPNNKLRLYAIKIDKNCFVITGGAIKMSQRMEDHPGTKEELEKLFKAKNYLENEGVFDVDSFYEFINEEK